MWVAKWKNVPEKDCPATTLTTLSEISCDFFPNISSLLQILATIPITTGTA